MRVLVLTSEYPRAGAPNRASFNRQHLNALAGLHELRVVCPVPWIDYLRGGGSRRGQFAKPGNVVASVGVDYLPYVYPSGLLRGSYDRWLWYSIRSRLLAIAREFRPDLVLGIWAFPDGAAALRLARMLGVPVAVQVLGSDINLLDQYPEKRSGTFNTLRGADHVITVSDALRRAVVALGVAADRVSVVYRGIDADLFQPRDTAAARRELGLSPQRRHLLFVGNLVPVKNPGLALRAFLRLETDAPVELHIVGAGPLRDSLAREANDAPASRVVRFHGIIDHRQIPVWMAAADVLVLSSDAEGVPNVLLEARAMGCPYVATRVGGIPEVSAHPGARVVAANDLPAMREAIDGLLREPPPREPVAWQSWDAAGRNLSGVLISEVQGRVQHGG